jgi:putative SOS response-associated peptidase YedK
MPVIVPMEDYDMWLDTSIEDVAVLQHLMRPYDASLMTAYAVSKQVNRPGNDNASLIEPA